MYTLGIIWNTKIGSNAIDDFIQKFRNEDRDEDRLLQRQTMGSPLACHGTYSLPSS